MNDYSLDSSKKSVSDKVYSYIKSEIIHGNWKPGDKIPSENSLCQTLGVSRISVRSAIEKLTSKGILTSFQGKGTFVCDNTSYNFANDFFPAMLLNQSDKLSMYEFRRVIEIASAGFAASRITNELVTRMKDTIITLDTASDSKLIVECGIEFHRLIALATNNNVIISMFEMYKEIFMHTFLDGAKDLKVICSDDHRHILYAIESRNVEMSKKLMDEHLNNSFLSLAKTDFNKNQIYYI